MSKFYTEAERSRMTENAGKAVQEALPSATENSTAFVLVVTTRTPDGKAAFSSVTNLPGRDMARLLARTALQASVDGVADVLTSVGVIRSKIAEAEAELAVIRVQRDPIERAAVTMRAVFDAAKKLTASWRDAQYIDDPPREQPEWIALTQAIADHESHAGAETAPILLSPKGNEMACKHEKWIQIASHERPDMSAVTLVYGPGLNWADELRWCIACGALQRVAREVAEPWMCPSETCTHTQAADPPQPPPDGTEVAFYNEGHDSAGYFAGSTQVLTLDERRYVEDPPSEAIAADLNARRALMCTHDRDPCYLFCGVETGVSRWPYEEVVRPDGSRETVLVTGEKALAAFRPWHAVPRAQREKLAACATKPKNPSR